MQHEFKLGGDTRLQLSFNVLNLFNQDSGVSKYSTYQKTDGVALDEAAFYAGSSDLRPARSLSRTS